MLLALHTLFATADRTVPKTAAATTTTQPIYWAFNPDVSGEGWIWEDDSSEAELEYSTDAPPPGDWDYMSDTEDIATRDELNSLGSLVTAVDLDLLETRREVTQHSAKLNVMDEELDELRMDLMDMLNEMISLRVSQEKRLEESRQWQAQLSEFLAEAVVLTPGDTSSDRGDAPDSSFQSDQSPIWPQKKTRLPWLQF